MRYSDFKNIIISHPIHKFKSHISNNKLRMKSNSNIINASIRNDVNSDMRNNESMTAHQ